MTTDPPPTEFEDVRIDNWQTRLPSAICTDKEIFDEIFSLETWKTVLTSEQRNRIMKMLPPEVLKNPEMAEKTMEDLFSKSLTNFDSNPLDTVFDNLLNGHYDPEVVKTKANIVREWRRESRRMMKQYHTQLLQDIVISREKHLRQLIPVSPTSNKKNGKKSVPQNIRNATNTARSTRQNNNTYKKNGKGESNGVAPGGKGSKSNLGSQLENSSSTKTYGNRNGSTESDQSQSGKKGKRGRLEAALTSPPLNATKEESLTHLEGPTKKKAKPSQTSRSKPASNRKPKDSFVIVTSSQPLPSPSPSSSSSQASSSSTLLHGNVVGTSFGTSAQQGTSILLGTLTTGSSPLEPPTLTLRSPSSQSTTSIPSSLLESLMSPGNTSSTHHILSGKCDSSGQLTTLFPSPVLSSSSSSQSFLQSPVQSSPILASQLQAPSPISVNLSTLTGVGLGSSRSDSITDSPSNSSITLNYTQTPPPSNAPSSIKGLGDDSSSDEFEFETIEPTIGFSGPSTVSSSKSSANIKTLTSSSASAAVSALALSTPEYCRKPVSTQDLQNIQKCSLLTNCLTQPLPPNSSSNEAVSAALANNILTSTPVPVSTAILAHTPNDPGTSSTLHHHHHHHQHHPHHHQVVQQSQSLQQHKIIVASAGSPVVEQQQQLQKFLSLPPQNQNANSTTTLISQQQLSNVFQQTNNVICANANVANSAAAQQQQQQVDAQTLVNSIMANPKDLLATFGASLDPNTGTISAPSSATAGTALHQVQNHQQHQHQLLSSNGLPIAVNLQTGAALIQQQHQIKHTFITTPGGLLQRPTILGQIQEHSQHQQILSLASGAAMSCQQQQQHQSILIGGQGVGSTLNTETLQQLQLTSSLLPNEIGNTPKNNSHNSLALPPVPIPTSSSSASSIPNILDNDDLAGLNLGSYTLGGVNLDMGAPLPELDSSGIRGVVGNVDNSDMDCGIDKMDDLSGVLEGNPFDSIPNLSDELDGIDLDMVDGLCDFEVLLSEEKQYASFFSLIRDVLCSTKDHRMTLGSLEKTIKKWSLSSAAAMNPWYLRIHDWNNALIIALNFLAGSYQDVHPEDFVPYIEYKYKTKYYQWIGAGRDGDNNLSPLSNLWMDNLEKLPPLKKNDGEGDDGEEDDDENEDSDCPHVGETTEVKKKIKRPLTPPPPRFTTDWTVRSSTQIERQEFRAQEKCRYDNPHKAFTYRMHGYESVVGPVKGVYSSQTGVTNKARGHSLLVDERPPYVTILALVRDAVARLPNGEGTRSEICEMLRDSTYLALGASNVTLNSVVSGALDRLHYERDPCVRYDSHKKSWIYLHRDRTQEQFERLHHNRSYTKSTKTRNNSNRKSRKGTSKNVTSSTSASTASTPATATTGSVVTTSTAQSSPSSSSQSSLAESIGKAAVSLSTNVTTPNTAVVTGTGNLVTLPPVSSITPKLQAQQTSVLQQQGTKTGVGVVSVSASNQNAQVQQPQQSFTQSVGSVGAVGSRGGLISFPISGDGQQQGAHPSLNEILAAATGLRFQTGGTQGTARLVLQQSQPQTSGAGTQPQPQGAVLVQSSPQNQAGGQIAPGQILLSPSSTVLKLAGNIRLSGEGLRFTQLRLPTVSTAGGGSVTTAQGNTGLRLPQHRILLARGGLPGKPQTQGVLLGQTATGQTVILSAGPAGGASALAAGLQQALNSNNGNPTGQISLHAPTQPAQTTVSQQHQQQPQLSLSQQQSQGQVQIQAQAQAQTQTVLETNKNLGTPVATTAMPAQTRQQQVISSQSAILAMARNASGGGDGGKFEILGSGIPGSGGAIMVSTVQTPTGSSSCTGSSFTSPSRGNPVGPGPTVTSTLPPTSIALPPSLVTPAQIHPSTGVQSNTNLNALNNPPPQQQVILTSANNGGGGGVAVGGNSNALGLASSGGGQIQGMQQSLAQNTNLQQQLKPQQQSFILQPQPGTTTQQIQGLTLGQGQGQLTAPIIIRSAQGEFVSFGIPSNLSLGRGVQGIKVIPFQTGNKTVLARIVAPSASPTPTGNALGGNVSSSPLLVTGGSGGGSGGNLLSTVSAPSTSSAITSAVISSGGGGGGNAGNIGSPSAQLANMGNVPNPQYTQHTQMLVQSQPQQQQAQLQVQCPTNNFTVNSDNSNSAPVSASCSGGTLGGTITLSAAVTSSPSGTSGTSTPVNSAMVCVPSQFSTGGNGGNIASNHENLP